MAYGTDLKNSVLTIDRPLALPSVGVRTMATVAAIAGAVLVPEVFHALGAALGLGTALGRVFLPMYLPVALVGFLAGPIPGVVTGLLGPCMSFLISGMPTASGLPLMMVELACYGLSAGLLRRAKMSLLAKVLLVQATWLVASIVAICALGAIAGNGIDVVASVSTSVLALAYGIPGIALQWVLLPLVTSKVGQASSLEEDVR